MVLQFKRRNYILPLIRLEVIMINHNVDDVLLTTFDDNYCCLISLNILKLKLLEINYSLDPKYYWSDHHLTIGSQYRTLRILDTKKQYK